MTARRGVVYVPFGARAGDKLVLEPGAKVTIGRAESCDLVVPLERGASKVHCELTWDGENFFARDLESLGGTLVVGQNIAQFEDRGAYVPHGGLVEIGATSLVCYHELGTLPREAVPRAHKKRYAPVIDRLAHEIEGGLYAVLDCARSTRIPEVVRECADEARSLYEGLGGQVLDDVAPYLVKFERDSKLLRALVEEGWGDAWGVYLTSDANFSTVRRHLRRFLMAEVEETRSALYFRYYDPRVLGEFMSIATVRQKSELYAEIRAFFFERYDAQRSVFDLVMLDPSVDRGGKPGGHSRLGAGGGDVSHP